MKNINRICLSAATLAGCLFYAPLVTANASSQFSMAKKVIELNGQLTSSPMGFISDGTTFMPIYYVMQALEKYGIQNTWNGSVWNISIMGSQRATIPEGGTGPDTISANGQNIYHVNGIVTKDPASQINTTYMPVWYVMQVLTNVGIINHWDGTNWTISGTGMPIASGAGPLSGSSGTMNGANTQNQAANDSNDWVRASKDLYLTVSTDSNFSSDGTKPLLDAQPGQSLYLLLYSNTKDINQLPEWSVNSPDASIVNDTANDWTLSSRHVMVASFTAAKPGIYTIQALENGEYSIPLVVIVGMNQLSGQKISVSPISSGVQPLPAILPSVQREQGDNMTYEPYQPINGWLPVSGTVSNGASTVVVDFESADGANEWNYVLPVQNSKFNGMVRIPMVKSVHASLIPDMWNMLNQMNGSYVPAAEYDTYVSVSTLPEQDRALLSSAMMDWNMDSSFSTVASILVDNSPSKDTAIAAISNYVSEKVVYDYADYHANKFIWKNSTMTWQNPIGVCEDIAELSASMLKSVGIPVETLTGTALPTAQKDDHEWMRAFDGVNWLVVDPTWNSANGNINTSLSNEYMTMTDSLLSSHVLDRSQSYTWQ